MTNDALHTMLREYLTAEVMNDPDYPLEDDEPLISSGLIDSFSLMDIALWIENTVGVEVDNTELNADSFDTLNELVAFIEARRG